MNALCGPLLRDAFVEEYKCVVRTEADNVPKIDRANTPKGTFS